MEKDYTAEIIQPVHYCQIQEYENLAEIRLGERAISNLITEFNTIEPIEM